MTLSRVSRTKESFRDKIAGHAQSSQIGIFQAIGNFENFCMEKYGKADLIADMKKASEDELFDVLQNWINWNSSKAPRTVSVYFSRLRKYLHYMGIKLDEQDIKSELDFKHTVEEELYGLTLDDIHTLFKELRYKHKVLFICQLSSLMRIAEIVQLRKKHLILGQKNIIVKIPSTIAKNSKGRTTFFSKEATRLLIPLLKKMDDNDVVFGSSDNPKLSSYRNEVNSTSNAKQVLRNAVMKTGLTYRYESTGRLMISTHSFRAFGITRLSRLDQNFAKKIAGQKGYLLQYDRMSDEEKLGLYEKFESELTIDVTAKQKQKIQELEAEKTEISSLKKEMEEMRAMLLEQGNEKNRLSYYEMVHPELKAEMDKIRTKLEKGELKDIG